jgi:hydroxymethylglutaryl-CoA lyase
MSVVISDVASLIRPALPAAVAVREVGLRDGLQLEASVPLSTKLDILDALVAAGVREIEVTSFVSRTAVPALADAEDLVAQLPRWSDVHFSALVAGLGGARRAVAGGMAELQYVVSAADGHSLANARRTTAEAVNLVKDITMSTHELGGHCEVIIATAWDCPFDGRTPVGRVVEIARRATELGADRICLADTIGTTVPARVTELIDAVQTSCPGVALGIHCHNTRGAGLAAVWAALEMGVTRIDASVGGLGGCPFAPGASGNIATEELVYLLEESGIATGIDLDRLLEAASIVESTVGHELTSNLYRAGGRASRRSRLA